MALQASDQPPLDSQQFRKALGCFATGVTIITTSIEGTDVGLTASSFNSVSLDPPMVLWSLGKTSRSLPAFETSDHFAVHVLGADQEELSQLFATRGADKFAGLKLDRGPGDVPLLDGCAARFECRKAHSYQGGDHVIFVGEVLRFDRAGRSPLLFHEGRYARTADRPDGVPGEVGSLNDAITHAYFALRSASHRQAWEMGLTWTDLNLMGTLLNEDERTLEEINATARFVGLAADEASVQRLAERQFLRVQPASDGQLRISLEPDGRACLVGLIAAMLAREADATMRLGDEAVVLKRLLSTVTETGGSDDQLVRHMDRLRGLTHSVTGA